MLSFSISRKENENLILLLIKIKIHGSSIINQTWVTLKTPTYKAKEVSEKHLFLGGLFLQEEIIFLGKELDNKQIIIETLLQQMLEADSPSKEYHL